MSVHCNHEKSVMGAILAAVDSDGKDGILRLMQQNPSATKQTLADLCNNNQLMHSACALGDEELVIFLTAFTLDINAASPMGTPLSIACEHGYEAIVDTLLCNQAILSPPTAICRPGQDTSNFDGAGLCCPFYQAVIKGWVDIIKILVETKPGLFSNILNCKNLLTIAAFGNHLEIFQYCIDTLTKLTSSKEELASFICNELLVDCLEWNRVGLLSCFFGGKLGASVTSDLASKYSDTIGTFLQQFALEKDSDQVSQDEGNTGENLTSSAQVKIDWSKRNLCSLNSLWISAYTNSLYELDLSHNDLEILPDVIPWHFANLHSFSASHSNLKALLPPSVGQTVRCQNLQCVDLSHNLLSDLPVELFDLPSIEKLCLSDNLFQLLFSTNSLESTPVLWGCVKLKELNLSNNSLECLPFQIHSCVELVTLLVSSNKLTNFLHPWSCPLKSLNLSDNSLTDVPLAMDDFWSKSLLYLNLSRNALTEVPQTICRLASLKELDLSHNNISSLPSPDWWECMCLECLDLSHNKLGSLPSSPSPIANVRRNLNLADRLNPGLLARARQASRSPARKDDSAFLSSPSSPSAHPLICFPNVFSGSLTELNLSHNRLKEVPISITELFELTRLDLSYNPGLSSLPFELCHLSHLQILALEGLSLSDSNLNKRIQGGDNAKVFIAYLKQIHRNCVPCHRVKVMLVGNQEKGKTSLAYALRELPRPSNNLTTHGVEISEFKLSSQGRGWTLRRNTFPELTVQLWDFAGQRDYYITHKVFLSSSALYIVVFDLRLGRLGVDSLHPWLSDIQANAPDSVVIIVGTFLDCLTEGRGHIQDLRSYIQKKYCKKRGFPKVEGIVEISNVSRKEGLDSLRKHVYDAALKVRIHIDNYGKVNYVGRQFNRCFGNSNLTLLSADDRMNFSDILAANLQIPKDYFDLIKVILKEAENCRKEGRWPVLNADEFWSFFSSLPNSNIRTKEEMELAAQFLNESGYVLHFVSSSFNGLESLYFIDPQWLSQTLAKFIGVDSGQRFTRGGIINIKDVESALLFSGTKTNIGFNNYVDLLESFDIALRLSDDRLLLPSKLPSVKPGFLKPLASKSLRTEAGRLHRIYRMNHVPSGFWSRLLVQMLATIYNHQGPANSARTQSDNMSRHRSMTIGGRRGGTRHEGRDFLAMGSLDNFANPKITFWQEGICIDCDSYHLLIESIDEYLELSEFVFDADVAADDSLKKGIVVIVTKISGEEDVSNLAFVLAAFAIDYIDSLISQWYPGLLDEGCLEQLIPCPYCLQAEQAKTPDSYQGVHMFSLIECAKVILSSHSTSDLAIRCPKCASPQIQLRFLVPDLLLLDLPGELHVGATELVYDPITDVLGRGGEGTVFRGSFNDLPVAIKQNTIVQSCREIVSSIKGDTPGGESFRVDFGDESDLLISDYFWKSRTLNAFNGYRQETSLLARLRHPCIISLLGIYAPTLSYVMELSPHGSLRHVLHQSSNSMTSGDREGKFLSNKVLVYKIICQIIHGLQYLHSEGIVYKDLKPENILIWSLDVDDVINIKLSDYGLARRLTKQGLMGIEGTTGYQAPEIRQEKPYNEKVDIFAFAMVAYELTSGEPLFSEMSSVLINKFILQGKRPMAKDSKAMSPLMLSLIERCWAHNPSDRPSASEIADILQDLTFVGRQMVVYLEANRILSSLSFTYWDKAAGSHQPYLRFWTGNETGRCYHVFNAAVGQFKVANHCHPGPKVTCMILVNKFMVIGTERPSSLQVMGFSKTDGQLVKLSKPFPTDDIPLLMLPHEKEPNKVFVGFANSDFHLYELKSNDNESTVLILKDSILLSDNRNQSATCGISFNDGSELWIGCGPNIVVVDVEGDKIHVKMTIVVFPAGSGRFVITTMCGNSDQVWCLNRRDMKIVELDFESRNILCILDCSQPNPLDTVVSNFDLSDTLGDKTQDAEENLETAVLGSRVSEVPKKRTFIGKRDRKSMSYRRKLLKCGKGRTAENCKKTVSALRNERVRCMCFVRGALWVGRERGDIMVINVTHNNPYGFEHGQVIAMLNVDDQEKCFSTEHLVNMNDERVVSTRTSRDPQTVRQSTHLVTWSAFGLDRINQYRNIWKLSSSQAHHDKLKSLKSPSIFTHI